MEYIEAVNQIKKGQVRPVYLLYGEEAYLLKKFEQMVIQTVLSPDEMDMNLITFDRDPSVNELVALIETVPFMGGKNLIIVRGTALFSQGKASAGDDSKATDKGDERLLQIIATIPEYTHVVFIVHGKADKRKKIFKMVEKYGATVEVASLKVKDVRGWLVSKLGELNKEMTRDAMEYFLGVVSMMPKVSLGFLDHELNKIALFTTGKSRIGLQDLEEMMSSIPEISIFALTEAVSQKQLGKALQLIGEQLKAGDHPLKLIPLLARQVRMMWQAKEMAARGCNGRDVAEKLGLVPFIGEKMLTQSRNFTGETLKQATVALAMADSDLKSGRAGQGVLEEIIIEMCM